MQRRSLLKGLAAGAALSFFPFDAWKSVALAGTRVLRRVRPGDPAWPKPAEWAQLKAQTGGNLIEVAPLLAPCMKDGNSASCQETLKELHNPFFLGDQPGGTQVSGWLDAWTPAPSVYAVKAESAAHVAAAVNFARLNSLRLVVKGTGHSYLGTSSAPDSLLVWTRAMNRVTLHDAFVPKGGEGKIAGRPAVSAGAGCVWIDLYHAVTTEAGRYVQGGGCTDTGVAGLVQSGGFGNFSKAFGTAASGLIEAEIVTADGEVRIANAFQNSDLFWGLKGGGGGSFGVVTRLTLKTHELPKNFGGAWGKIAAKSDAAFRKLIARFLTFYADGLYNPNWGEQFKFGPDNTLELSMVCQGLEPAEAKNLWQPFFDFVRTTPTDFAIADEIGAGAHDSRDWWKVKGNDSMTPDDRAGAPAWHGWWNGDQGQVGAFLHGYESLWLPASLLAAGRRAQFADTLFAASRYKQISFHCNKGLAGGTSEAIAAAKDTATNPAVCDAFALAIIADGEKSAYPGLPGASVDLDAARKDAHAIAAAAAELYRMVPGAGSYVSESNYFNPRWQQAYWGDNYQRLRTIKDKYDPDGMFVVHHGVGSEDWSPDGFERAR